MPLMVDEPPEHLAPRLVDATSAQVRLGPGLVPPVVEPARQREGQGGRHVNAKVESVISSTRLKDQDFMCGSALSLLASTQPG